MSESKPKNILGIIPVRMESQRLPNKPLAMIGELPLVIRVWQQASQAQCFKKVVVATDSQEIAETCKKHGAEVVFTSARPRNGSERVFEAMEIMKAEDSFDIVFNVQGDMPFIVPGIIDLVAARFSENLSEFDMATLCLPIKDPEEYQSDSCVKVIFDSAGKALYFSRSPIPHYRDSTSIPEIMAHKHIGLYAFRPAALKALVNFEPSRLEQAESLEQLRALENNLKILTVCADRDAAGPSIEVDTPKDLEKAKNLVTQRS